MKKALIGLGLLAALSGCSYTTTRTEIYISGDNNKLTADVLQDQLAETKQDREAHVESRVE